MKKVVITGATGFVGSHLAKKLLKDGVKVYGVGRNKERLDELTKHGDFIPVVADFEQYENLHKLIDDRDFCMFWHLAWEGTRTSAADSAHYDYNIQIRNIKAASDAATTAVKIRSNGSSSSSSKQEFGVIAEDFGNRFNPSVYGVAKKAASDMFRAIAYKNNMKCNNIIFPAMFGVEDNPSSIIVFFIKQMLANEPLKLVEGHHTADWVYIDDLVDGIVSASKSKHMFRDYYIGHKSLSVFKEKLVAMKNILSSSSKLEFGEYPEVCRVDYDKLDLGALYNDTGFEITSSFEERILQTAEWVKTLY